MLIGKDTPIEKICNGYPSITHFDNNLPYDNTLKNVLENNLFE